MAAQRLKVVDCDIHPAYATPTALHEFLPQRWRDHWSTFGTFFRPPLIGQLPFPRMMAGGMRIDSFPRTGSPPGGDLELMRTQHLDANGVEVGMLIALSRGGMEERNLDFAAALSTAANDWQLHKWCEPEPRLRGAIVVPQEHTEHAVAEIERRSSDPAFVQILMSPRAADPLGNRRYWPIYAAAEVHTASRSRCMWPASRAAIPPRPPAGPPTISRSTSPRPPACRARSQAWCSRACSSASPGSGSC